MRSEHTRKWTTLMLYTWWTQRSEMYLRGPVTALESPFSSSLIIKSVDSLHYFILVGSVCFIYL